MVFMDTSAWAAYFNKKDSNHRAAVKIWKNLRKDEAGFFTTDYIVDETLTLLKIRANADVAIKGANAILASNVVKMVRVSDDIFSGALEIFKKYKEHLFSFTDCTSFEVMKKIGLGKVFTFDNDFRIMGFEVLGDTELK